jgi:predicted ATPase/DNA-binding NarL/FixJ family response regulator
MLDRSRPNNLPLPLAGFVGREAAVAEVQRLLVTARLLTLTGPAGVGKTRLALEVAFAALEHFQDGVWWVGLAPLCDASLVAHEVAMALRLPENPQRALLDTLGEALEDKDLLLVLDNCEHLVAACAELAEQLLHTCPHLHVLATSREALGVGGETVWRVPPLPLPCLDDPLTEEGLEGVGASQLFLQRARTIRPDLPITAENAAAIGKICCRLDGLPLAIELAAARVQVLSLPQIAARLDDRFRLLTAGSRTADLHQLTLKAAIDWSYDLLTPSEQKLFERLAVFAGGFSLEAAEAVTADEPDGGEQALTDRERPVSTMLPGNAGLEARDIPVRDVLDLLSQLVLKSLVEVQGMGQPRYQMLETIRQYASERLLASGDLDRICQRHLIYYLELALRAEAGLIGEDQSEWLALLRAELDNLRTALTWSQDSEARESGLHLAAALAAFWLRVGYLREGSGWLERALLATQETGFVRAKAMMQAGRLAQQQGNYDQALAWGQQSLALSRSLGEQHAIARALGLIGWVTHWLGDRDRAASLLEEALARARESGDERTIARTLLYLGDLFSRQGAHEPAAALLQEGLHLYQQTGDSWSMAWALRGLGEVARLRGEYKRAVAHLQMSLSLYDGLSSRPQIPYPLEALALTAADQGQFRRAAQLWGAASALRDSIHTPLPPSYRADAAPHLAEMQIALGETDFATALAEGRELTLEQALALAAAEPSRAPAAPSPPSRHLPQTHGLTPREVEVLRLVAEGLSDAQIAEKLVISPRTVGKHVQSIYSKLYLSSRSAATRWAIEHNLA